MKTFCRSKLKQALPTLEHDLNAKKLLCFYQFSYTPLPTLSIQQPVKSAMIQNVMNSGGPTTFFFTAGTPSTTILFAYSFFWHFSETCAIRVIHLRRYCNEIIIFDETQQDISFHTIYLEPTFAQPDLTWQARTRASPPPIG